MKALVAGCALAAAASVVLGVPAGGAAPAPSRVQVSADEHTLVLSRTRLRPGPAVVQLVNRGEDDHDLALRRIAPGAVTRRLARTAPGGVRELETTLRPGRYRLWCTLADHRARGMSATLVVTRAR